MLALVQSDRAQSVVSVTSLGAHPDGIDSASTTAAFRRAFANNPRGKINVPPGSYLIDNSNGPLTIENFSGELLFQESAELVFTNNSKGGLLFEGGSGAVITGLRATYATPPTIRKSPNEQIKFSETINTVLKDTVVKNSPAAGILFYGSINPTVTDATVIDSLADGLNFSNCQNARVTNLLTHNTGDDGLAFVNYTRYPDLVGGMAKNVVVIDSKARGIAIAGQSNVTVDGFHVESTSSSGVLVAQDNANGTRVPANDVVENGTVYNAGTLAPLAGNQYGVEFYSQVSATFTNISVFGSGNNGLSGSSPDGSVTVNNVTVSSPLSGVGFLFYQTQNVQVKGSTAYHSPSYGFLSLQSKQVSVEGLTIANAGVTDPLKRAVWFEDAETVSASAIKILFTSGMASIVGCYSKPGSSTASGSVKSFSSANGAGSKLSIQNNCPNVVFGP